jgi:hypothetical protein
MFTVFCEYLSASPPAHKLEYHPLSAVPPKPIQHICSYPPYTKAASSIYNFFFVTPNNSQTRLSEKDGCCTDPVIYFHLLLYRTSYRRHLRKMSVASIFISCRRSGNSHWTMDNRIRSSSPRVQRTVHVTIWTPVPEILRVNLQSVFAHFRRSELTRQSASSLTQCCHC